ncbi:MAG: GNAT family N-acetyltransferase [Pedobacter sp.]|nr:MAG: GNAT family N-acetyltransferase [Pedobacter sp.]
MFSIKRTDSEDQDFVSLVKLLDAELAIRDGADSSFYAQFNKIDSIKNVVVVYLDENPIGCGAFKPYDATSVEVKRMYVSETARNQKVASQILTMLEVWAKELGYKKSVLETGKRQPEAIALYTKAGYQITANYGQYIGVDNSVCFEKTIAS